MHRILLATALASTLCFIVPSLALAGATEDAFLAKLVGSWTGSGAIKGGINGTMACTLIFRASRNGVHFSGRCDVGELGGQSFSGDLGYNDTAKRYEAHSSSGGVVVGVKHGKAVAFATQLHGLQGTGTSTMTVTTGKISIDVDLVDPQSHEPSKSHVTFSK